MAALEVNVSLLQVDLTGNLIGMAETIKVEQLTHHLVQGTHRSYSLRLTTIVVVWHYTFRQEAFVPWRNGITTAL